MVTWRENQHFPRLQLKYQKQRMYLTLHATERLKLLTQQMRYSTTWHIGKWKQKIVDALTLKVKGMWLKGIYIRNQFFGAQTSKLWCVDVEPKLPPEDEVAYAVVDKVRGKAHGYRAYVCKVDTKNNLMSACYRAESANRKLCMCFPSLFPSVFTEQQGQQACYVFKRM